WREREAAVRLARLARAWYSGLAASSLRLPASVRAASACDIQPMSARPGRTGGGTRGAWKLFIPADPRTILTCSRRPTYIEAACRSACKRKGSVVGTKTMVARLKWVGWKGIGAVLTLAGAIVGLVVLILPTSAFGGPGCGGSTMRIFNFDPPSAKAGSNTVVTIYGANLKEAEDSVWVGPKGNQTPTSSF